MGAEGEGEKGEGGDALRKSVEGKWVPTERKRKEGARKLFRHSIRIGCLRASNKASTGAILESAGRGASVEGCGSDVGVVVDESAAGHVCAWEGILPAGGWG